MSKINDVVKLMLSALLLIAVLHDPVEANSNAVWKTITYYCVGDPEPRIHISYGDAVIYISHLPYVNICVREVTLKRVK